MPVMLSWRNGLDMAFSISGEESVQRAATRLESAGKTKARNEVTGLGCSRGHGNPRGVLDFLVTHDVGHVRVAHVHVGQAFSGKPVPGQQLAAELPCEAAHDRAETL